MARAAAKRKPAPRHDDAYRRKHKDSGGQRYEDQLFFNRLRKQTKWVFAVLAVIFGLTFVLFGVGSSVGGSGLADIFNGIRGSGGNPSIDKPLKRTQENPKDAKAWNELASAYDLKGDYTTAIPAWETYVALRPKDPDALTRLATDYEQQFATQTNDAALAQAVAQQSQATSFGPPPDSPLGRGLGSQQDPIGSAVSNAANASFNTAMTARSTTASKLVAVYQKLAKVQPTEAGIQFQLAQAAENAGDAIAAVAAYKRFLQLAPDDLNAPQAKARLKALQTQTSASSPG